VTKSSSRANFLVAARVGPAAPEWAVRVPAARAPVVRVAGLAADPVALRGKSLPRERNSSMIGGLCLKSRGPGRFELWLN